MHVAVDSVNQWLAGRVPGLGLDGEQVAALSRADGTVVVIEVDAEAGLAHLSSVVCPLPDDGPEDALFTALQLNRFGRPLGGCWLAWDDGLQVFLLCHNALIARMDEHGRDRVEVALDCAILLGRDEKLRQDDRHAGARRRPRRRHRLRDRLRRDEVGGDRRERRGALGGVGLAEVARARPHTTAITPTTTAASGPCRPPSPTRTRTASATPPSARATA